MISRGSSHGAEEVFRDSVTTPITANDGALPTSASDGYDPKGFRKALLVFDDSGAGSYDVTIYRWSETLGKFCVSKPAFSVSGSDIFTIDTEGDLPVWLQFSNVAGGASVSIIIKPYNAN